MKICYGISAFMERQHGEVKEQPSEYKALRRERK